MNNYRPISVLPTLHKIIKKWIEIKRMSYFNKHKLLRENQSGFRKNHTAESVLILMTDIWLGQTGWMRYARFSHLAFDLVNHQLLLKN